MAVENPVIQAMLEELRDEDPELGPIMHQCLEMPACLLLLQRLEAVPHQWSTPGDLAGELGQLESAVEAMLSRLVEQRIVACLELHDVGMRFYRLADPTSEREKPANFQSWRGRWQARLSAANQLLDRERGWRENQ